MSSSSQTKRRAASPRTSSETRTATRSRYLSLVAKLDFWSEFAAGLHYNSDMQAGADSELIEASQRGDRSAFAAIIERYQRAVYAVAFSGTRDRTHADDVTQDTFVIAWRRLAELRDIERLPAWLCGIARNLARDTRKRRQDVMEVDVEITDATTPYDALSDAESERIVATALGQVPDVYREPLVLFYYEERSVADVARCLGISAATTNKRLSRGRRYLAERVELVERGVTRRGASATLAASVLAVLAITAPAAHVEASPLKGSTMHKLAIAAAVTASLAAGGAVIVKSVTSASAKSSAQTQTQTLVSKTTAAADHAGPSCSHGAAAASASARPSLPALFSAKHARPIAAALPANDCATVGRHLADLEGATGHDQDDPARCATDYASICESQGWSLARRVCTLAADDLLNAHICGFETATSPDEVVPPELACATVAAHITPIVQSAGFYIDVSDFAQQAESACDAGNWSVALRRCFVSAQAIEAIHGCIQPSGS
jgi:RNA polymerase sigma factor (sigma-70 family)